jgi:hypothetical protein
MRRVVRIKVQNCIFLKIHGITLFGNTIWCWEVFIKRNFPTLLKGANEKYATDANRSRRLYLQSKVQTLVKDTQTYSIQICDWAYRMQKSLKVDTSSLKLEHLRQRCNLFLQVSVQLNDILELCFFLNLFLL